MGLRGAGTPSSPRWGRLGSRAGGPATQGVGEGLTARVGNRPQVGPGARDFAISRAWPCYSCGETPRIQLLKLKEPETEASPHPTFYRRSSSAHRANVAVQGHPGRREQSQAPNPLRVHRLAGGLLSSPGTRPQPFGS